MIPVGAVAADLTVGIGLRTTRLKVRFGRFARREAETLWRAPARTSPRALLRIRASERTGQLDPGQDIDPLGVLLSAESTPVGRPPTALISMSSEVLSLYVKVSVRR